MSVLPIWPSAIVLNILKRGNFIAMGSTTATVLGLTWAGIVAPWGSARVLVPLILGVCGLVGFMVYEALRPANPLVNFLHSHIIFILIAVCPVRYLSCFFRTEHPLVVISSLRVPHSV